MPENGLRDLEQVSRICVTNDAGFVLHWYIHDINTNENGQDSGNYPID
jgi:hypothetical protein